MNRQLPLSLAAGSMLDIEPFEFVAAAAAAGFESIGLRLSHQHALAEQYHGAFVRHLADHGVFLHDVEVHRVGTDPIDQAQRVVDAAAALGARAVLVVSDLPDTPDGRAATERHLGALVERAGDASVRVGLEYMAWTTPRRSTDAAELARRCGAVVVADVLHHVRLGETAAELAHLVASGTLGWVQVCDAPAAAPVDLLREARHHRLPPGRGGLPLESLLAVVPTDTTRSVEVQSDDLLRLSAAERAVVLYRAAAADGHRPNTTG